MKYPKKALTFADQADLLLSRGLIADRNTLISRLETVNYYRLSAYWHTFRVQDDPDSRLRVGTTLDSVWERYVFDRQLRIILMDAIERVEVAIRTRLVNQFVMKHGPFGYLDSSKLASMPSCEHTELIKKIRKEAQFSQEEFVVHYREKYTMENDLPLWMACELFTFGTMLKLFSHVDKEIKSSIAAEFGVADKVMESWLKSLNYIRNLCAHHARLWNRWMGNKEPAIPRKHKHPEWHVPIAVEPDRLFAVLTILYYLLNAVDPENHWRRRLTELFNKHPSVPLRFMGFPDNWMECPIWSK